MIRYQLGTTHLRSWWRIHISTVTVSTAPLDSCEDDLRQICTFRAVFFVKTIFIFYDSSLITNIWSVEIGAATPENCVYDSDILNQFVTREPEE